MISGIDATFGLLSLLLRAAKALDGEAGKALMAMQRAR
jgi:hypothetical protein